MYARNEEMYNESQPVLITTDKARDAEYVSKKHL